MIHVVLREYREEITSEVFRSDVGSDASKGRDRPRTGFLRPGNSDDAGTEICNGPIGNVSTRMSLSGRGGEEGHGLPKRDDFEKLNYVADDRPRFLECRALRVKASGAKGCGIAPGPIVGAHLVST